MKSFVLSVVLSAITLPSTTHAISWEFDPSTVTCDGSPFTTNYLDITCSTHGKSSSHCTLGDTATITGNLTAFTTFDSTAYVILQPCIKTHVKDYEYCPKKYAYSAGGVCEEWLTPSYNECGQPDEYMVDYSVQIPNKLPKSLSWLSSMSHVVTVKVQMLQEDECTVDTNQYYNGYYGYTMVSALGFSAGLVCAMAYIRKMKKRSEANGTVEMKNVGGDYIEMLDGGGKTSVAGAVV